MMILEPVKAKEILNTKKVQNNSLTFDVNDGKIQLRGFSGDGAEIKVYLSNDGNNWHRVEDGEMFEFEEAGRRLFWKMEAYPKGSKYVSPFLERIRLGITGSYKYTGRSIM